MIDDATYLAWLKSSSAQRVALIKATVSIAGIETPIYMSTRGAYATGPAETPANTLYLPIAKLGVLYTERLATKPGASASMSAGTVEVDNTDGVRDAWAGYVWTNRPIEILIGDARWPLADFRPAFAGVMAGLARDGRNRYQIKLRDKLQRLNTPLTDTKLGGSTPNKDALKPRALGQVHNVPLLLVDPVNLIYMANDGPIKGVIEVRDDGMPLETNLYTVSPAAGTITMLKQPFGQVTASIQGDQFGGVYRNTVATLIERIVTGFGKDDRFTAADVDSDNLAAFDTLCPQPVSTWVDDRTNILDVCQYLAGSVGAQAVMSRAGKLRLLRLDLPPAGTPTDVFQKDFVENSLTPVEDSEVLGAVKLGFNRNWAVQDNLQTRIPPEHKDLFSQEWLTTTKEDAAVRAAYRLTGEPVQQDTALLHRTDADVEAQRRLDLWKQPRTVYEFDGFPQMLMLELGQAIRVHHPRYGMANGTVGMVVSLAPDWNNAKVKVGFIV